MVWWMEEHGMVEAWNFPKTFGKKLAKFGVRSIYHFFGIKNFPNRGQKQPPQMVSSAAFDFSV